MILITRPEDDAKKLSIILDQKQIAYHIDSLISFSILSKKELNITSNIFLISSIQSIYSMQKNNLFKNPDLVSGTFYVIGNRSSQLLKDLGMVKVEDTFSDFNSFNNFLSQSKTKAQINYLCGDIISQEAEMAVKTKKLNKIILYKTIEAKQFSNETVELINSGKINSVMLYSKYTSSVFQQLLTNHVMEEKARDIEYYCLSKRIAEFMQKKGYNRCIVCDYPDQNSMISAILKK
mgnify:CR=1 FL=1